MRETLIEAAGKRVLVCDGAMGTELSKRGLAAGACPELFNIDAPEAVLDVLNAYRKAGADILISNSFGGNRWKLSDRGLGDRVAELNKAAVVLARKAAGSEAFVLGDVGPTGRFMEPLGPDPRDAFVEVYAEQARALADGGADAIILETFTWLDEILAALEGAKSAGLPVIASMSYAKDAAGTFHTVMGNSIPDATKALDAAGADIIAANCGLGAEDYAAIVAEIAANTSKPVMVQPNAGMPQLVNGETVFPMSADEFMDFVEPILAAGARIIGGCCGTTPEHISGIRRRLSRLT